MAFKKPCLDCGALSYESRCEIHRRRVQQLRDIKRAEHKKNYYNSDYRKRAAFVRQTAIICHICGDGARVNDPWQADHLEPGNSLSPLAAAHRSCNASRGNKPLDNRWKIIQSKIQSEKPICARPRKGCRTLVRIGKWADNTKITSW